MSRLTVSLLGPFQATLDGRALNNFRTSKIQVLLIYLLMQGAENDDHNVGREQATTLLWPEMPRKSAQVNLRQTLYHLRRAIPELNDAKGEPVPFILSDRQVIQVNPAASYELDVAEFLSLVSKDDLDELAAAVELYCQLMLFAPDGPIPAVDVIRWQGEAITTFRKIREDFYAACAYHRLGWARYREGQPEKALQTLQIGINLAQQADVYVTSILLRSIAGITAMKKGMTEEAVYCYREAAELQQKMGAWVPYAHSLSEVATIAVWREGDLVSGRPLLEEALTIAKEQKDNGTIAHVLAEMTTHQLIEGRYKEALAMTEKVLSLSESHHATAIWSQYQRGIAYLGLGEIEEAVACMITSLVRMIKEERIG